METDEYSSQSFLNNNLSDNKSAADGDTFKKQCKSAFYPLEYDGDLIVLVDTSMSTDFQNNKLVRNGIFLYEKCLTFKFFNNSIQFSCVCVFPTSRLPRYFI